MTRHDLAITGLGVRHLDVLQHLGAAEFLDLDRLHDAQCAG